MNTTSLMTSFKNIPLITVVLITAPLFILGVLFSAGFAIGSYNGAASLRNTYEMKVESNSAEFDNMWKKLKQAAEIPEQKKNAFKDIFEGYAGARSTGGDNQMMTWIKEAIPNADISVYDNLMNIIVGSRDTWTMKQTELVSVAEQYNKKLVVFPGNIILPIMGFELIKPKVITSTRTQQTFETGQDDDVALFPSKK